MGTLESFNIGLGNLARLSEAKSRSICAENITGAKGMGGRCELADGVAGVNARALGKGWKVNPFILQQPGETTVLAEIEGPGVVNHIWVTPPCGPWRASILRIYWDDQEQPSVECPVSDFFACGWNRFSQLSSLAVCVNPGSALNCYWSMPFRRKCRITLENQSDAEVCVYYQVDYSLQEVPEDAAYFHAQFRRSNPVGFKEVHTILDGVKGKGHYVGTFLSVQPNHGGWWGEGEVKFYMDGDEWPTICGTGLEDYFCGSYNFENAQTHQYQTYTTPYAGMHQVIMPDGLYHSQQRFSMYRWHLTDPIRFDSGIKVTIQALGWVEEEYSDDRRYWPLQDDYASVAYWYQTLPTAPFPPLPDADHLRII